MVQNNAGASSQHQMKPRPARGMSAKTYGTSSVGMLTALGSKDSMNGTTKISKKKRKTNKKSHKDGNGFGALNAELKKKLASTKKQIKMQIDNFTQ